MKIKYPHLTLLLTFIVTAAVLFNIGAFSILTAVTFIALGQLALLALEKPQSAVFTGGLTTSQVREFEETINRCSKFFEENEGLFGSVKDMVKEFPQLKDSVQRLRKSVASNGTTGPTGVRWIGNVPFVSEDCARALTSIFVLEVDGLKALESLVKDGSARERVRSLARETLGISQRTAMGANEIPVPTIYAPQIIELVFRYGQARQFATVFPLGAGTVKLPRLAAGEDDFGYLGAGTASMSQPVPEKRVTAELVTFTANKAGGTIRIPYELEEDTFVPIGQFLARYIARQLAKLEDKTLFLADGTATYAGQTGIAAYCEANPTYLLKLEAGKTKPSDATLDDFRYLRAKVSAAILGNMAANGETSAAYYLHPTSEPFLRGFNKYPNFVVFEYVNGRPMLDGWPVRWIGLSQSFQTIATPEEPIAFFGDLSFWYLGERGTPRIEVSREVYFATDELAMRALERIDVQAVGVDAMATLKTGAAVV